MFEPRLALSASLAGDWILDAFAGATCQPLSPYDAGLAPPSLSSMGTLSPLDTATSSPTPLATAAPSNAFLAPQDAAASVRELYQIDGSGQTVAIIDTGIAWDHVAFATTNPAGGQPLVGFGVGYRVVGGWDFAENDANPYDDGPAGFHGTHVAGILAGQSDGFAGVAPGADIVALRVFDDFGIGKLSWVESALRWVIENRTAFENPITTVNLSLGVFANSDSAALSQLNDELEQLRADGVIVVGAAGNSFDATRPDAVAYPASHSLVAAVSSVDTNGNHHAFSQRGDGVFAAPGGAILSSIPDHVNGWDGNIDDFAAATGTSMATPQVAGATMLIRQAMQSIGHDPTPEVILAHLRDTSQSLTDSITGATYHRIDLHAAIETLLANPLLPEPDGPSPAPGAAAESEAPDAFSHLVWTDSRSLTVTGTEVSNQITVDLSSGVTITVDSVVYALDRPLDNLAVHGGLGTNSLEIIGSSGVERVIMRAATAAGEVSGGQLTNTQLVAEFQNFQNIRFVGGGNDRVTMFDSPADDTFEASAHTATLRGTGYTFAAEGVANVYAHATAGGLNTAYLYDSAGDDTLAIRHQFTSLRSESAFRLAYGFQRVYAFAGSGGYNQAFLYDSPGDDTLSASQAAAWISGRDYYAGARGFDLIRAESTAGGNDVARIYAPEQPMHWTRTGSLLQMSDGEGQVRSAQGFASTQAYAGGQPLEIIPQSIRSALYEEERWALQTLFASLDDEPV